MFRPVRQVAAPGAKFADQLHLVVDMMLFTNQFNHIFGKCYSALSYSRIFSRQ